MSPGTALVVVALLLVFALGLGLLLQRRRARVTVAHESDALAASDFGLSAFAPRGTVVQFSTAYCQRCPAVRRAIGELVDEQPGISFAHVDVTDDPALANKYRLAQTPTILLIDGSGRARTRLSGPVTKPDIDQALTALLEGTS